MDRKCSLGKKKAVLEGTKDITRGKDIAQRHSEEYEQAKESDYQFGQFG